MNQSIGKHFRGSKIACKCQVFQPRHWMLEAWWAHQAGFPSAAPNWTPLEWVSLEPPKHPWLPVTRQSAVIHFLHLSSQGSCESTSFRETRHPSIVCILTFPGLSWGPEDDVLEEIKKHLKRQLSWTALRTTTVWPSRLMVACRQPWVSQVLATLGSPYFSLASQPSRKLDTVHFSVFLHFVS